MNRLAWVVLLAACGNQRDDKQKPITPPVQELDRLPELAAAAAPDEPPPPDFNIDQVLECFANPIKLPLGRQMISSVTTGDFDGDRRTDVVLTYETLDKDVFTGHVDVYRNTGDGKLVAHSSIPAGDMVYAVSSGDIDNDGKLDLAVGDPRGAKTRLYAGQGDGTFVEKPAVSGRKSFGATLVDLDGDGKLDLITELFSAVAIWKGDGKFGFKRRMVIDTGQAPDGPVVGDLDGDGTLDLGYVANDEGYFFTLKGPVFKLDAKAPSCSQGGYTSGGDFDDDGDIDLGYVCDDKIELRLNDGKGRFKLVSYPYGPSADPIIAADLTRDGKTDLLVSHRITDTFESQLTLLAGQGGGEWKESTTGRVPIVEAIKVADMDGDQKLDIVVATWDGTAATLYILLRQDC